MILAACQTRTGQKKPAGLSPARQVDIQGHRGARGLLPENTIPAFKKALDLGVTTLELDLCVTGDGQLIVSHEPWISPNICRSPDGEDIPPEQDMQFNIYRMDYDQIRQYDCGSKPYGRFPDQQKIPVSKPLLTDMIAAVRAHGHKIGYTDFGYNIEIKSQPQGDDLFHPRPAVFSEMVYRALDTLTGWEQVTISRLTSGCYGIFTITIHRSG